jgi:hypothetical protein
MCFIVNYAPNFAVRFDVNGNSVERLNHAYRPEKVSLTIGRQANPAATVFKTGSARLRRRLLSDKWG